MSNDKLADAIDGLLGLSGTVEQEKIDYLVEVLQAANAGISVTVKGDVNGQLEVANQIIKIASTEIAMPADIRQSLSEVLDVLRGHVALPTKTRRLFLSYAWADDQKFVERLYTDLTARGYSVWWDRTDLASRGTSILQELRNTLIEEVERVIPIIGPAALESANVQYEWDYARLTCKIITPVVRLGDTHNMPDDFKRILYFDFRDDASYEAELDRLLASLETPVAPLGEVIDVPKLPPHFLARPEDLDAITEMIFSDLHQPTVMSSQQGTLEQGIASLQGMGGIGKSVLASAFAHQCETQRIFRDGIIWLSVGRVPDMRALLEKVGRALGDDPKNYPDEIIGKQSLGRALSNKTCLMVLDDVWGVDAVKPFCDALQDPRCRLMITTRNLQIGNSLGAQEHRVGMLTERQAVKLLSRWTGHEEQEYAIVARKLGCLPLALTIAGARMSQNMTGAEWLERFERISIIMIDRRDNSLKSSIDLSVEEVFPEENGKRLYYSLGIFKEDARIPQLVIIRLWRQLRPDLSEFECEEIINDLVNLALLDRHASDKTITLHDLLHSYNREQLGESVAQVHLQLLAAYNPRSLPWYEVENDGYLYFNLAFHMQQAGLETTLYKLLVDAPEWTKNISGEHQHDLDYLLLTIWDLYYPAHKAEAHSFLTKWLTAHENKRKGIEGRNPKVIAVQCAFRARDVDTLALALRNADASVQDASVRCVFHLNEIQPEHSLNVVQAASKHIMRFGVPDMQAIRVLFPLAMLLLIQQYQHAESERNQALLTAYTGTLRTMLRQVTYVGSKNRRIIRSATDTVRTLLVKSLKRYVQHLLGQSQGETAVNPGRLRYGVNNLEEFACFFELNPEQRENVLGLIPYLDRSHGSLSEIHDQVFRIFALWEQLSITFANFVIMGRAWETPDEVFTLYQHVFGRIQTEFSDEPNLVAGCAGSIAHALYSTFDRQDEVRDEWLTLLKEVVRCHIEGSPHGYGITETKVGRYLYYSPMYYGAIWSRVHPDQVVDLVEEYLARAKATGDKNLLLYIITSLGERATHPTNYQGILVSLQPYLDTDDPEVQKSLVSALAIIRNKRSEQVDHFLETNRARHIAELVQRESYAEPITELARRLHEFVVDFLSYAEADTLQRIVNATEIVMRSESLDEALEKAIKEIINGLVGEKAFVD